MVHKLEVNFLSWVNFRDQQQAAQSEPFSGSQWESTLQRANPRSAVTVMVLSGRRRRGVGAVATAETSVGHSRGRRAGPGLASGLRFPARGLHRRAPVRVGAAAALGPGPSRSLLHRRRLPAAARCSRRARPRPIPPPTGTSPLSPRQTRKVRLSPQKSPFAAGSGALRGGVFLVPRRPGPGRELTAPRGLRRGPGRRGRVWALSEALGPLRRAPRRWGRLFWVTCSPQMNHGTRRCFFNEMTCCYSEKRLVRVGVKGEDMEGERAAFLLFIRR